MPQPVWARIMGIITAWYSSLGQILVQIKARGICGSDIHAAESDWTPRNIVMGHEFSGVVSGLGAGVDQWKVGQRVAPFSQISCGKCAACLSGDSSKCENLEIIDYDPKNDGGYSEYVVMSAAIRAEIFRCLRNPRYQNCT